MRGKTLLHVLDDLRVTMRLSQSPAHNVQVREAHVSALRMTQDWLWSDFDWPHLRVERQMPVEAGQRYYSPPADVIVDRIEALDYFDGATWFRVQPGIGDANYSAWNSDLDQRSSPIRRWRIAEDNEGADGQIEVWPISDISTNRATREGYLKVVGIRNVKPFRDDADTLDLDDQIVILYTAARLMAATGDKSAGLVLKQADQRQARLRGQLTPRRHFRMFGTGRAHRRPWGPAIAVYQKQPGT
jgi:hypothetical protein